MTTLKFGFKKTISARPLKHSKSNFGDAEGDIQNEAKDYVHSIEGIHINGVSRLKNEDGEKDLIIPMIHKNHWRRDKKEFYGKISTVLKSREDHSLEQQAVAEILESAKLANENGHTSEELDAIPLLLQNRVPDGFETDDKLDVSLRAEESTLDDYERIPIEQFGLAMLRGMGWKKTEGIGLKNKKVIDIKEPQLRPRGLGLGAEKPNM